MRLHTRNNECELEGGQITPTPPRRDGMARPYGPMDAVVLLTVALRDPMPREAGAVARTKVNTH